MEQIKELVVKGKYRKIAAAVQNALDNGIHAESILQFMAEAMDTVGECFQKGEIFVPEMLIAAKTMKLGLPSALQMNILGLPRRSLTKAICLPSGLQQGEASTAIPLVRRLRKRFCNPKT